MIVELNGRPIEVPDHATVEVVVSELAIDTARRGIAVAVDAAVVPRSEWERRRLSDGARVEVLAAMQGG
ncbi:MAG: sulfur carrier protein ThiS [Solirubrobacteraceae bacterium]